MEKIKLFTHNDMDGIGCIIIAGVKYGLNDIDYEICSYDNIDEKVQSCIIQKNYTSYNKIYITDISINDVTAKMIEETKYQSNYQSWKLLDHHKTAELLNYYDWANVTTEKNGTLECGTSLFLDELFVFDGLASEINYKRLSLFVEFVRSYDTWDWKKDNNYEAKQLNDIFKMVGEQEFIKYYNLALLNDKNLFPEQFLGALYYINENKNKYMENKLNKTYLNLIDENGNNYISVLCDRIDCTSELGSKLLDKYKLIDYVMLVFDGGVSIRSREIDVSIIAKKHGGGGHKNAAGFKCVEWWKWLLN